MVKSTVAMALSMQYDNSGSTSTSQTGISMLTQVCFWWNKKLPDWVIWTNSDLVRFYMIL